MYSFFYGTFTRASTNNLDSATNSTFHTGGSILTNPADSSIAHTPWKKKEKAERKREARQKESEIQKSKVGGKNNLKL